MLGVELLVAIVGDDLTLDVLVVGVHEPEV